MPTIAPRMDAPAVAPVEPVATPAPVEVKTEAPVVDKEQKLLERLERQEKQFAATRRELQAQRKMLEEREAKMVAPQPDNSWQDKVKADPINTLVDLGYTYDQIANMLLAQNPTDQNLRTIQNEMKALKDGQTKVLSQMEEKEKTDYQSALTQISSDVKMLVQSSPDDFEILAARPDAQKAVVDLIEQTYKTDKYVMAVEDACREVEEYMVEEILATAKLKKIQSKLSPSQEAAKAEVVAVAPKLGTPAKISYRDQKEANTLSHNMVTVSTNGGRREARERAILAFKGELK